MEGFEEGYEFFEKSFSSTIAAEMGSQYVSTINSEIDKLVNDLNSFSGYASSIDTLKGDVAEFWHADSFNINAALNGSKHRAYVDRSHELGSADITTNFGDKYGSKYYKTGSDSANEQAISIFEKYKRYQSKGGKESFEEYLKRNNYPEDTILSDPLYSGQKRLIPSDQMKEAIAYLERKIAKESSTRPDQVKRYQETLDFLTDKIKDNKGNASIELSNDEAKTLATLAKEGNIDAKKLGLTTEELVKLGEILKESFRAGLSAATISIALAVAPEIINAVKYLIDNGELDGKQFKEIGYSAVNGAKDGFLKGAFSAAITTACKSGRIGELAKEVDPSVIGAVTVIAVDAMLNAIEVANGRMTRREMANELVKEMFTSTCSLISGSVTQSIIEIPVLGFMIGSFVGSLLGSVAYSAAYSPVMSFCVDTGFTMFGLVDQDYELPEEVLKEIGIEVFDYEKFDYSQFEPERFEYKGFSFDTFESEKLDIRFLRRGVIGVSKIGFI